VGSSAGSEDAKNDGTLSPQAGERGVDLRDFRSPDRIDFVRDRASEVVTGAGLGAQEAEKDVRQRHGKPITQ